MKGGPVVPREQARRDIDDAVDFYLAEAGEETALRFIDALEHAFRHIGRQPATGSPRHGLALGLPGLRCWPLTRFPFLVFYAEAGDRVDVWRVLHAQRDIPVWLDAPGDS